MKGIVKDVPEWIVTSIEKKKPKKDSSAQLTPEQQKEAERFKKEIERELG